MGTHAGGLHDAAQGFFTPTPPGLIGGEHRAETVGLAGKGLAVGRKLFDLPSDFSEGGRLEGVALLEPSLVGLELILQRFDQRLDALFAQGQVPLGRFLEAGERLVGQTQEFWSVLLERFRAQAGEALLKICQGLLLRSSQFRHPLRMGFLEAALRFFIDPLLLKDAGSGCSALCGGRGQAILGLGQFKAKRVYLGVFFTMCLHGLRRLPARAVPRGFCRGGRSLSVGGSGLPLVGLALSPEGLLAQFFFQG